MKLGLVLSGGGTRGIAHLGAIKVLEENNITIDYISGASSGSIIASMYAMGYTIDEIYELFKKYATTIKYFEIKNIFKLIYGIIFKHRIITSGLNSGKKLEKLMKKMCKQKNIETIKDVKMPLIISATSLQDNSTHLFSSIEIDNTKRVTSYTNHFIYKDDISLPKCVRASCSFPGIFEPLFHNNIQYIDGGVKENHPWRELKKLGADKIICITFEEEKNTDKKYDNFIEIVNNSINMIIEELSEYELHKIDMTIKIKVPKGNILSTDKLDELYYNGYYEINKQIDALKEILKQQKNN